VNDRRRAAVELLLKHPDWVVAEMVGVRPETLRRWMVEPEFASMLRERETEQRSSAARMARQAVLNAAAMLCQITSEAAKPDPKLLIELLKLAGVYEPEQADQAAALAEVVARIDKALEATSDGGK